MEIFFSSIVSAEHCTTNIARPFLLT